MLGESDPRWLHIGVSFEFVLIDAAHHKLEFIVRMPLALTYMKNSTAFRYRASVAV